MQIEDALELFVTQLEADGRSPHTIAQYRRHIRLLAGWAAQGARSGDVGNLDHQDVARFLVAPVARTRPDGASKKAASVNALRSSLKGFFGYLHRAGLTGQDPSRLVRPALGTGGPPRGLSDAEQERLLAVLDEAEGFEDRRDRLLFRLMLLSGVRLGSALALGGSDVDPDAGELHIRAKGGSEQRVFLPLGLASELAAWCEKLSDPAGPVFTTRGGRRLSGRHVQRRFQGWLARAEIRREASPHSLRHSFAMRLYAATSDVLLVKEALGHRSITSTMVYARVDENRLRQGVRSARARHRESRWV